MFRITVEIPFEQDKDTLLDARNRCYELLDYFNSRIAEADCLESGKHDRALLHRAESACSYKGLAVSGTVKFV